MSVPSINRSLTTIRTELEFLVDSNVITEDLYDSLILSLPRKYKANMEPYGIDKLQSGESQGNNESEVNKPVSLHEDMSKLNIAPPPPPSSERTPEPKPVGNCEALYDYSSQEPGDLSLKKGDRIFIVEKLSQDWWKGFKEGTSSKDAGVFPSNYVKSTSEGTRSAPADKEKASYNPQSYSPAPPHYQDHIQQPQPLQTQPLQSQPSYGGYAQFPPPSTNYYQSPQPMPMQPVQQLPQPQQEQQQPPQQHHEHFRKFGSKLGNAAIFGAGATIGSDLVNSIF